MYKSQVLERMWYVLLGLFYKNRGGKLLKRAIKSEYSDASCISTDTCILLHPLILVFCIQSKYPADLGLIESQSGEGRKGCLEVFWSNSPDQAGPPGAASLGLFSDSF